MRGTALILLAGLMAGGPALAPAMAQGTKLPWDNAAATTAPQATAAAVPGDKDGLSLPVALFVLEPAAGYGMYTARNGKTFGKGDPVFFYLEPAGYGYARDGDLYRFGATVDLKILQDGKPIFTKDNFLDARFTSHHPNKEINVSGRLTLDGAPKGDYELLLLVHDTVSGKSATTTLPFSLE